MTLVIESYFTEAKRQWGTRPQWVVGRGFYEMWEQVCLPKPFWVLDDEITIFEQSWTLKDADGDMVGYYRWDDVRNCAVLTIEAADWDAVFNMRVSPKDGSPQISDPEYIFHEGAGLSHGERLEVMYDVVACLTRRHKFTRLACRNLNWADYIKALDEIERYYEDKTIRTLRRLPREEMLKLVCEALEDTPREEQESESDLLDYQKTAEKGKDPFGYALDFDTLTDKKDATFPVYPQTRFFINEELRCIADARRMVTQYEKICKIELRDVQIIDDVAEVKGEFGIKFRARQDLPVVEGDTLTVYGTSGEQEGTLMVDIYDGAMICGRLRFDDRAGPNEISDHLWALPVPSSAAYLAEAMDHLADSVERGGKNLSEATQAILGLNRVDYYRTAVVNAPGQLDGSQAKAWAESVDVRNPVVLVQGPPGTGKTSVLAEVLRTLVSRGCRLMVAAPSNAAVDNLIRRVIDLPVLRIARQRDYVAPDIGQKFWEGDIDHIRQFVERIKKFNGGAIFAGTQVSLMKSQIIADEIESRGPFDAVIFDEAGMTRIEELMLCADMGRRAVLFGDHRQLLPFPLPQELMVSLKHQYGGMPRILSAMLERSALEWLCESRKFPTMLLENCYRCQNPRLIRFSSTLFYNAAVRTHSRAEYYRLPPHERQRLYPASTLSLYNTSRLPPKIRTEKIVYEGLKPGIENRLEAEVCAKIVEEMAERHPLAQITVIVPYRRQVRLIRFCLNKRRERSPLLSRVGKGEWEIFLSMRISTVDSFQGGESDAVVISYVRSNEEHGVGFVDEPNRINVAHTRCRRELIVVGDFKCLKEGGGGRIFNRMERAFARDGRTIDMSMDTLSKWGIFIPMGNNNKRNNKGGNAKRQQGGNRPQGGQNNNRRPQNGQNNNPNGQHRYSNHNNGMRSGNNQNNNRRNNFGKRNDSQNQPRPQNQSTPASTEPPKPITDPLVLKAIEALKRRAENTQNSQSNSANQTPQTGAQHVAPQTPASVTVESAPKRRGRPAKIVSEAPVVSEVRQTDVIDTSSSLKRGRGRPSKGTAVSEPEIHSVASHDVTQSPRRGRPSKNSTSFVPESRPAIQPIMTPHRGRPKKVISAVPEKMVRAGSTEPVKRGPKPKVQSAPPVVTSPHRGPGRPKKLNPVSVENVSDAPKKRGRPPKTHV